MTESTETNKNQQDESKAFANRLLGVITYRPGYAQAWEKLGVEGQESLRQAITTIVQPAVADHRISENPDSAIDIADRIKSKLLENPDMLAAWNGHPGLSKQERDNSQAEFWHTMQYNIESEFLSLQKSKPLTGIDLTISNIIAKRNPAADELGATTPKFDAFCDEVQQSLPDTEDGKKPGLDAKKELQKQARIYVGVKMLSLTALGSHIEEEETVREQHDNLWNLIGLRGMATNTMAPDAMRENIFAELDDRARYALKNNFVTQQAALQK